MTKEGEVKVCDFGLSKRKKDGCVSCIGSPYWMAPELAESNYTPDQKYDTRVSYSNKENLMECSLFSGGCLVNWGNSNRIG